MQVTNGFTENKEWLALIFKTELISGEIKYKSKEILQVKWFTYEEIISIKDKLRSPKLVLDCIEKLRENKVISIDMINIERK